MNFAEALNVKGADIERPPLPPLGHYLWNVKKVGYDESKDGKWDIVNFQCSPFDIGPAGDVDPQALKDFGGLKLITLTKNFMFSKDQTEEAKNSNARTLFAMKQFIYEQMGVEETKTLREAIDSAVGRKFLAPVQYREDKRQADLPEDQRDKFAEIGRTAPIPQPGGPATAAPATPAGEAPARRRAAG